MWDKKEHNFFWKINPFYAIRVLVVFYGTTLFGFFVVVGGGGGKKLPSRIYISISQSLYNSLETFSNQILTRLNLT
jgi:hypothetical protein